MHVRELFICTAIHTSMLPVYEVTAIKNRGLLGDHRASASLVYKRRLKRVPQRQVSFMDLASLEEGNEEFCRVRPDCLPLTTIQMRRQIVTEGIDLNSLIGKEFQIGNVRFLGTTLCEPCSIPIHFRQTPDRPYLEEHYKPFIHAFKIRGGLCAEVLSSGVIRVGDRYHSE